jgi:hypothetical protein
LVTPEGGHVAAVLCEPLQQFGESPRVEGEKGYADAV